MHRLHPYPDVQVMFRRLLIATLIGLLAALAVALFRHAMVVLETLFLGNDSGSLVNAAQSLPAWRRLITPALGGLAGYWVLGEWHVAQPYFLVIASSSFVYVALADLIPQLQKRLSGAQSLVQIGWLLLGVGAVVLVSGLVHGGHAH